MSATRTIALQRIERVGAALPVSVRARVVFIGGIVLPLLVNVERRFNAPRTTKDVDAVMATTSYGQFVDVEEQLRFANFRHVPDGPISRWITPAGDVFDLTAAGSHTGGTGSPVDAIAIELARAIPEHTNLKCLSPIGFFLMKVAAFFDRGQQMPIHSRDLSDLGVLLLGAAGLEKEATETRPEVRALIRTSAAALLDVSRIESALRSHFHDREPVLPDSPDDLARDAIDVLRSLARVGMDDASG